MTKNWWNVPHAFDTIDGKYVAVRCPPNKITGCSVSVILLLLVNANYKYLLYDIGGLGTLSDCKIFNKSELKHCLENDTIQGRQKHHPCG